MLKCEKKDNFRIDEIWYFWVWYKDKLQVIIKIWKNMSSNKGVKETKYLEK